MGPGFCRESGPSMVLFGRIGCAELEALQVGGITSATHPQLEVIEHAIKSTVGRIFGTDTIEYERLKDVFPRISAAAGFRENTYNLRGVLVEDQQEAIGLLRQQISLMKEQLGEDGVARPIEQSKPMLISICILRSPAQQATCIEMATTRTPLKTRLRC